jgi:hypothetical protein
VNWHKELQEVATVGGLLELVNDYILDQPQDHWDWIPESSHHGLVASEQELQAWHHQVTMDLVKAEAPNIRLQDLAVFLLRASARAHEIARMEAGKLPLSNDPLPEQGTRRP